MPGWFATTRASTCSPGATIHSKTKKSTYKKPASEIEAFWNFSILKQGKPCDLKSLRFCAPRPPKLPQAWQCCFGALSSAHHFYWAQLLSSTTVETVVTLQSYEKCSERYTWRCNGRQFDVLPNIFESLRYGLLWRICWRTSQSKTRPLCKRDMNLSTRHVQSTKASKATIDRWNLVESSWVGNKTSEGSTKKIERMFKKKNSHQATLYHWSSWSSQPWPVGFQHVKQRFSAWTNGETPSHHEATICSLNQGNKSPHKTAWHAPPSSAWSFEPPSRLSSLMLTWHPRSWLPPADQCLEQDHDESP